MARNFHPLLLTSLISIISPWLLAGPLNVPRVDGDTQFRLEEVASGLATPWGMAFISATEILITERQGSIKKLDLRQNSITAITGVAPVLIEGQGGLLDVAVPPGFSDGDWIYFTYSKPQQGQGVTTLARARLKGDRLRLWQDLLITLSGSDTSRHFGSRIAFDDEGHLFFGVGDRGVRPNAQDRSNHAGSILRLNLDGSLALGNPFIGSATIGEKKVLPEIWSYGHRNPQGISYDPVNKRLWVIEHGPRGGDEINLIEPGSNYGWPVISYGKEYWGPVSVGEGTEKAGMEQPSVVYIPSIAPGSLLIYSGKAFPKWRGSLFSGALKLRHLNRIQLNNNAEAIAEEWLLTRLQSRIRALVESPEGWIYLSTDSGRILRIRPEEKD
ncbi:MAG: PQQ-dependent sugar dehydrogenase [Motiliproteus sp.]